MRRVHVFVATTGGPVRIESIVTHPPSEATPPVTSMALVRGEGAASFSTEYRHFIDVMRPRLRHNGYFIASVESDIPRGSSWQLGLLLAHEIQAEGALTLASDSIGNQDWVILVTGGVTDKLGITSVRKISEKFENARDRLDCWLDVAGQVLAVVPAENDSDVPRQFRTYCRNGNCLTLVASDRVDDLLVRAGLSTGPETAANGTGRMTTDPVEASSGQSRVPLNPRARERSPVKRRRRPGMFATSAIVVIVVGVLLTSVFPHHPELQRTAANWLRDLPIVAAKLPERIPLPDPTVPPDNPAGTDSRPNALPLPTAAEDQATSDSSIGDANQQLPEPVRLPEPSSASLDELAMPEAKPPLEIENPSPTELVEPGFELPTPRSSEADVRPSLHATAIEKSNIRNGAFPGDAGPSIDGTGPVEPFEPFDRTATAPRIVIVPVQAILSVSIEPTFNIPPTSDNESVLDSREEAHAKLLDHVKKAVDRAVPDSSWQISIQGGPDDAPSIATAALPNSGIERCGLQDGELLIELVASRKSFPSGDRIHVDLTAWPSVRGVGERLDASDFEFLENGCLEQECVNVAALNAGRDAADKLAEDIEKIFRKTMGQVSCHMYRLHLVNLGREERKGIEDALANLPGRITHARISAADSHSAWEYLSSRRSTDLRRQLSEIVEYEGLAPIPIQVHGMTFRTE